jgi:glycosyltransferase involved in cell wall biosynthesis
MHRGIAIISTPIFGISEQLRDEQSGLFFEPGDIDGLVKAISRLAREPNTRKRLAEGQSGPRSLSLDRANAGHLCQARARSL